MSTSSCVLSLGIAPRLEIAGLGVTSIHALHVNRNLLPPELRPAWYMQAGLVGCFVFFTGISGIAFYQKWTQLMGR